jgi:hypothetical protein
MKAEAVENILNKEDNRMVGKKPQLVQWIRDS